MSGVAGNMAVTMGSYYLARPSGGKGMLLGNVLGRAYGKVVVVGGGVVGLHAANVAAGMGAQLVIFGRHPEREATHCSRKSHRHCVICAPSLTVSQSSCRTPIWSIGAVLIRGGKAPHVVSGGECLLCVVCCRYPRHWLAAAAQALAKDSGQPPRDIPRAG